MGEKSQELLADFIAYSNSNEFSICVFDLETQFLFKDIEPTWDHMSWASKQKVQEVIIKKLRISIGGILTIIDEKPVYHFFNEENINELIERLESFDTIVGHNLIGFDYKVLKSYDQNFTKKIESKTIDTLEHFKKLDLGWPGMEELGKLNFNVKKTMDTLLIPKLWRDGKIEEVKEYLIRDLNLQAAVFGLGVTNKPIKIYQKEYGKILGEKKVKVKFSR